MIRPKRIINRIFSLVLAAAVMFGASPAPLYAAIDSTKAEAVTGTYTFTSNENSLCNLQGRDSFTYSDRLFTGSAYDVDRHLATLSAQTAMATASYYTDSKERDHASNSNNIKALLGDLGFSDIETNKYYSLEKEENSVGCAVARKKITVGNKTYTLLAVLPRSANYKQEWVGNFTVGKGGIHQGFKEARDEILRFVKDYISSKNITGDLKVWITGHSRGGAVTNLLGGFFAEGGGDYFNGVNIDAENVYCYSFATPGNIRTGYLTKKDALSVAGYRGGRDSRYKNDSQGAAYTYSGADAGEIIQPHTGVYRCIKNCAPGYDIITLLPPSKWGYDRYGVELPISDGKAETKNRMKEELNKFAPFAYKQYTQNGGAGDEDIFTWKTFDLATLSFVDDPEATKTVGATSQAKLFYQRINEGLARRASDVDTYVGAGYQETLQSLAGIYGMGIGPFIEGVQKDKLSAIKTGLFCYLSYAKKELQAEDPGLSDDDAIAVTVEQLVEFITGKDIERGTMTVDDFFEIFCQYLVDNAEQYEVEVVPNSPAQQYDDQKIKVKKLKFRSKAAEEAFNAVSTKLIGAIPDTYKSMVGLIIPDFDSSQAMDSDHNKEAVGNFVFSMLVKCAYGDGGSKTVPDPVNAKSNRIMLYNMIGMFMGSGEFSGILDSIGKDSGGSYDGHNKAAAFLAEFIKYLTVETDPDNKGDIIKKYNTVDDAADGYLKNVIEKGKQAILSSGFYDKGSVFYQDVIRHCDTLKDHAADLRQILMELLLYEKDRSFSVKDNIRMISTLMSQMPGKVPCAHYNELYVAWMKAQDTPWEDPEYALNVSKVKMTEYYSSRSIKLSWAKAEDATDYMIAYREAGKKWTTKSTKGKNSYTVKKLKANGLYEFRVMAVYRNGTKEVKGAWSPVSYKFFARTAQSLTASKKAFTVKVVKVRKASGYQFMYGTGKDLANKVILSTKGSGKTKLKVKDLRSKKYYYVRSRPYKNYKGIIYEGILTGAKRIRVR
ncbi:MAG: fibronectin type III domain-containing protein [Lachnospiraceae bacterium]|nr:fibronectin type III domain-containing protein [Lachnospiraceae bacterium]